MVHLNTLAGCRAASADDGADVCLIWPCSGLQHFLPVSTQMLKCQKWFIAARKSLLHPCLPSQPQDIPRGELGFPLLNQILSPGRAQPGAPALPRDCVTLVTSLRYQPLACACVTLVTSLRCQPLACACKICCHKRPT